MHVKKKEDKAVCTTASVTCSLVGAEVWGRAGAAAVGAEYTKASPIGQEW